MIRLDDVKENVSEAQTVEGETTEPVSQTGEQTPEALANAENQSAAAEAQERTVPVSVVQKERKQRQELQRKIAELEGSQRLNQYDPNDMDTVLQHPFVQELLLKDAKRELTDYARETLDSFPNFSQPLKKAILKNARGFVNENTTDIETAKLDLLEYIESIAEGEAQDTATPTPKTFPIAATNVSKTDVQGTRPAEIARILEKPIDEWTDADTEAVDRYTKSK